MLVFNNTKIFLFIFNTHSYVPIKLCRVAGSIHLFRIRGRLNPENVKHKKNWIWDVLEIDWSDISIMLNDKKYPLKKDTEQEGFLEHIHCYSILCLNRERHGLA